MLATKDEIVQLAKPMVEGMKPKEIMELIGLTNRQRFRFTVENSLKILEARGFIAKRIEYYDVSLPIDILEGFFDDENRQKIPIAQLVKRIDVDNTTIQICNMNKVLKEKGFELEKNTELYRIKMSIQAENPDPIH